MKRDFTLKRRETPLPPEKLLEILRKIFPEEIAVEKYKELIKEDGEK